jgi:hypothetical protein
MVLVRSGETSTQVLRYTWKQFINKVFEEPTTFAGKTFEIRASYYPNVLTIHSRFSYPLLAEEIHSNVITITITDE